MPTLRDDHISFKRKRGNIFARGLLLSDWRAIIKRNKMMKVFEQKVDIKMDESHERYIEVEKQFFNILNKIRVPRVFWSGESMGNVNFIIRMGVRTKKCEIFDFS